MTEVFRQRISERIPELCLNHQSENSGQKLPACSFYNGDSSAVFFRSNLLQKLHLHGKYNTDRINHKPEGLFRLYRSPEILPVPKPGRSAGQKAGHEHTACELRGPQD